LAIAVSSADGKPRSAFAAARSHQDARGRSRQIGAVAGYRQRLQEQGAEPVGNTPEEFGKLLREEVVKQAEVVKVSGARAD